MKKYDYEKRKRGKEEKKWIIATIEFVFWMGNLNPYWIEMTKGFWNQISGSNWSHSHCVNIQ